MAGPKFTYFHARGRSTPIRLAFAIGGLDYEDDRVDFPAFMARKQAGDFPFGSVPALTVDGVTLAQTAAILRYVGKLAGLYPEDAAAALKVDCFVEGISDLLNPLSKTYGIAEEEPRLAARKTWQNETLVTMLGLLEKMIAGDFVMGDKMTIADLYSYGVFSLCQETDGVDETVIDKFPKFKAVCNRVAAHPKVAEWLSKN